MKRTALVRRTPLPRQTRPIKRSPIKYRPPRRLGTTQSDPHYLAFVRTLPCCAGPTLCGGRVDPHHAGRRPGIGMKAPDRTAIPLCVAHHRDWHGGGGSFLFWSKERRREWSDGKIAQTHVLAVLRGVVA